jgi:hypothetical protein
MTGIKRELRRRLALGMILPKEDRKENSSCRELVFRGEEKDSEK